jgi:8-oxo-dGTP diphosphatase
MLSLLQNRLADSLKLLQIREPGLAEEERQRFARQAIAMARRHACKVMVKSFSPEADGLHLTAADLMRLKQKPAVPLVAASCHTREELEQAMRLGLDFAVLGPVKRTASHATDFSLGWTGFGELAAGASIPVYAIGGLGPEDLQDAWSAGAHGLAMISGAWR